MFMWKERGKVNYHPNINKFRERIVILIVLKLIELSSSFYLMK